MWDLIGHRPGAEPSRVWIGAGAAEAAAWWWWPGEGAGLFPLANDVEKRNIRKGKNRLNPSGSWLKLLRTKHLEPRAAGSSTAMAVGSTPVQPVETKELWKSFRLEAQDRGKKSTICVVWS